MLGAIRGAGCESPLKHLGISTAPKRSTLAYANANRPWELYESIFMQLLEKCRTETCEAQWSQVSFQEKADEPGRQHHRNSSWPGALCSAKRPNTLTQTCLLALSFFLAVGRWTIHTRPLAGNVST